MNPSCRLQIALLAGLGLAIQVAGCSDSMAPDEFTRLVSASALKARITPPPAAAPAEVGALVAWQQGLREHLNGLFKPPAEPRGISIILREGLDAPGDLIREFIIFSSADGTRIPAILQRPRTANKCGAIVVIPGHVSEDDSGLRQLIYDNDSYQGAAATRLARAGFVTIAFELRGFGLLGPALGTEHRHVAYNAVLEGRFYKALTIDDARAAVDLLRSEHGVDPGRIGVTGASLGGELAVTLAALDERVKSVAWSSYGGRAGPFRRAAGGANKQQHYCHVIPGAAAFLRDEDVILLVAPRPALGIRGGKDYEPDTDFARITNATWSAFDAADAFAFETTPGRGHEFFVEPTVAFFLRTLGPACD